MSSEKGRKKNTRELLETFFLTCLWSEVVKNLGDSAALQTRIGRKVFFIEKTNGEMLIREKCGGKPDISVELNRGTLNYLISSKDHSDLVDRTKKCVSGDHAKHSLKYEVNAGIPRILAKGYFNFAKKDGSHLRKTGKEPLTASSTAFPSIFLRAASGIRRMPPSCRLSGH